MKPADLQEKVKHLIENFISERGNASIEEIRAFVFPQLPKFIGSVSWEALAEMEELERILESEFEPLDQTKRTWKLPSPAYRQKLLQEKKERLRRAFGNFIFHLAYEILRNSGKPMSYEAINEQILKIPEERLRGWRFYRQVKEIIGGRLEETEEVIRKLIDLKKRTRFEPSPKLIRRILKPDKRFTEYSSEWVGLKDWSDSQHLHFYVSEAERIKEEAERLAPGEVAREAKKLRRRLNRIVALIKGLNLPAPECQAMKITARQWQKDLELQLASKLSRDNSRTL